MPFLQVNILKYFNIFFASAGTRAINPSLRSMANPLRAQPGGIRHGSPGPALPGTADLQRYS